MDEEEELENTLIGQEEAPAMDTGDALIGARQPMLTADSNVVASVPGIENIRNPGAFEPANVEPVEPAGPPTTVGESIRQTYDESVLADLIGRGFGQEVFRSQAPDGTPTFSIFNKRFGILGSQVPYSEASPEAKAQAMRFMLETGGVERPLPETPTSPVRTPEQVQSILNEQRATESVQSPTATAQSFFGQAPASNAAEAAQRLIDAGPAVTQAPAQAIPEGEPGSPQANFAERMATGQPLTSQEIQDAQAFAASMGTTFDPATGYSRKAFEDAQAGVQATAPRSDLFPNDPGVQRTRDELMRRFGAPTIREIQEQDAMRRFGGGATPAAPQPPASALSDFERESIARQIRSGGTGSFAGDSAALQARIAERDRLLGETQTERDTRIARSRTQGSSRGGLSQADARDLAQGMARGATEGERARALQIQSRLGLGQFEPERELTDLEKREIESQIRAREAGIAAQERKGSFEPRIVTIEGERNIELSPGYFRLLEKDTPEKTGLQKTLENLQSDLDAGRLTQEEYDIATKNARDLYIGREKPKPAKPEETSGLIPMDGEDSELPDSLKNSNPSEFTGQTLENKEGNRYTSDGTKWIKV